MSFPKEINGETLLGGEINLERGSRWGLALDTHTSLLLAHTSQEKGQEVKAKHNPYPETALR